MARSGQDAAEEYRQALKELKDNNKMQINLMTILADDYNLYSNEIVDVLAQQLDQVSGSQKLAVMYVMDSILKNVTSAGNYRENIERVIHKVFVNTFQMGDERTRLALHRLRQTWTGIFQKHILYKLDLAINSIDPAWPVVTPHSNTTTAAPPVRPNQPVESQQHRASPKVHVNPNFLNKTEKTTISKNRSVAGSEQSVSSLSNGVRPGLDPRLAKATNRPPNVIQKRPTLLPTHDRGQTETVATPFKQEPSLRSDVDERHLPLKQDVRNLSSRNFPLRRKPGEESKRPFAEHRSKRRGDANAHIPDKKQRGVKAPVGIDKFGAPSTTKLIPPTNDPGAHAFITTRIARHIPQNVVNNSTPSAFPTTTAAFIPPSHAMPSSTFPSTSIAPISHIIPSSAFPSTSVEPMTRFPSAHVLPPPVQTHVISSDTPRLEGIPANNRIFVDGRAYQVSYINDVPIIERNGLPHRIYFTGEPRDVIIDGVAHRMCFGEEKKVIIDGDEHILRFGAPSRELYMGNFPFKGAFGGPPIFATINGVRHEIRLGGPPPEVKIEPDPCYELLRHMPHGGINRNNPAPGVNNANAQNGTDQQSSMDVKALLAKLQKSGILSAISSNNARKEREEKPLRAATPPIPSEHRGVTERMPKPPSDLKGLSMRALKIRYDSVVASICGDGNRCPHCGVKVDDFESELYKKHLDWHFHENVKLVTNFKSRCRAWYLSRQVWIERAGKGNELSVIEAAKSAVIDEQSKKKTKNVSCDAIVCRECGVCKEQFEEYWDEDDDAWKLKDCTLGPDGRGFHPACLLDASINSSQCRMEDTLCEDELCDNSVMKLKSEKLKNDLSDSLSF